MNKFHIKKTIIVAPSIGSIFVLLGMPLGVFNPLTIFEIALMIATIVLGTIFSIAFATITCLIDEEKIKAQSILFPKGNIVYWNEVKYILFPLQHDKKHKILYLLKDENVKIGNISNDGGCYGMEKIRNNKGRKSMMISSIYVDYKQIYKTVYDKFKDKEGVSIDKSFIEYMKYNQ